MKILLGTILIVVVVFLMFALVAPIAFGERMAVVLSESMEPALPQKALAINMPVDPEEVEVGDIIAYIPWWDPEVTVSHRVVEIVTDNGELAFQTKGDANEDVDAWLIYPEDITGKVIFSIPYLGYIVNFSLVYIRSWWGFAFLIAVPSIVVIGGTITGVSRSGNRRRKLRQLWLKRRQRRR